MALGAVERADKVAPDQSRRREVKRRNRYPSVSLWRGVCRNGLDAAHDCGEMSKTFAELEEREILALAIALEEEDSRIYRDFAEKLKAKHSAIASILEAMSAEESAHRARLLETYKLEYGDHVPFVRRQDVKGFVKRRPVWLNRVLQPQRA